ncbi:MULTISPECIES: hypothetical protein [unclassified Bacteroides]|uniref:hypothetical protein n=1 Tax=unclassified Bacteroides TaxID=2646097 RepID=UPI0004E20823|nr:MULTISPECIES: hypothetical protein [unclassified Bacteroides]
MSLLRDIINPEQMIGVKLLSDADLGRSPLSNQTHIGLSIKTLTFLRNGEIVDDAHFIYKDNCCSLCCNFDMILREDGRIDAPKIRKGYVGDSIVDEIRRLCYEDPGYDWYLVWFGLMNHEVIFWLIREESEDYELFAHFLCSKMKVYSVYQKEYNLITDTIEKKLNRFDFWKDIIEK